MKCVSFDIFDTCLLRKCGSPEAVFHILGAQLFPNDQARAREFETQRRFWAEGRARKKFNTDFPTLLQIYECLDMSVVTLSAVNLCTMEENLESVLLCGVDSMREKIAKYRKKHYKIIFISDMYLSSSFLKKILTREQLMEDQDFLYVSCECNASKARGDLYQYVKDEVLVKHWVHYGDNIHSDIKMAFRNGLIPKRVNHKFNRFEKKWVASESEISTAFITAGLSKALRLTKNYHAADVLAMDIIATMYIPFVAWVLKQAKLNGITKLLFFARDSYLFYLTAELLEEKLKTGISFSYFYVSRKSLYLPSLYSCTVGDLKDCDEAFYKLTWNDFKGKFTIADCSMEYNNPKDALKDDVFIEYLKEKSVIARNVFLDYVKQNGVDKKDRVGFVDLGWVGTGRKTISKIFNKEGFRPPLTFYFGVNKERIMSDMGDYLSYHYMEDNSPMSFLPSALIFEHYFSATADSSTIGYMRDVDKVIPIFSKSVIKESQKQLFEVNTKVVEEFTKNLIKLVDISSLDRLSDMGKNAWMELKKHPTYADYLVFKDIEVEHFGQISKLVPSLNFIKFLYLKVTKQDHLYWAEMSLTSNRLLGPINMLCYRVLKYII